MYFLEIYIGLCIIFFLLIVILIKISPSGWEDENGFHQLSTKENTITFPLKNKSAMNHLSINFKIAHYQNLDNRRSGHPITLAS